VKNRRMKKKVINKKYHLSIMSMMMMMINCMLNQVNRVILFA
jgi:hypothetical protein